MIARSILPVLTVFSIAHVVRESLCAGHAYEEV